MELLGIRREDKNPYERRVPLTPADVGLLLAESNVRVVLQPAPRRVFTDDEYLQAGAWLSEDLEDCGVIMGVKEIPLERLLPDRVYVFFSHTIKGQPHNMPLLRRLMELGCTLIDYERIIDDDGRRLVFFGRHAGLAGMIDILWAMGRRGHRCFEPIQPAHRYASLAEAKARISELRRDLAGLERPLVFGITGYGNVSRGAQEIVDLLQPVELAPEELLAGRLPAAAAVKVVFHERHLVTPSSASGTFELQDYYDHPERYCPLFGQYLEHLDALVNCIYWDERYPRLVTLDRLRELFAADAPPRLAVIGDISCDIEGSVEATVRATTQDSPVFIYDPVGGTATDGFEGPGVAILAVDNLPAELPREASESFSAALRSFIPALANADFSGPLAHSGLPDPVRRAVILRRGALTADYQHLKRHLAADTTSGADQ